MSLHVRLDDRLLHGQVTYGWLPVLEPEVVLVADDRAAGDEWERETYVASAPEADVRVMDLAASARWLSAAPSARVLLIARGPEELLRLVEIGVAPETAVVGGLHAGPGRHAFAEDLQISASMARAFLALNAAGIRCYYQPLPADPPSDLPELSRLAEGESGA